MVALLAAGSAADATIFGIPLGISAWALAAQIAQALVPLGGLVGEVAWLSTEFGWESGWSDSRWTRLNIENFSTGVHEILGLFTVIFLGIIALVNRGSKLFPGGGQLATLGLTLASAAGILAQGGLAAIIDNAINIEEQTLGV